MYFMLKVLKCLYIIGRNYIEIQSIPALKKLPSKSTLFFTTAHSILSTSPQYSKLYQLALLEAMTDICTKIMTKPCYSRLSISANRLLTADTLTWYVYRQYPSCVFINAMADLNSLLIQRTRTVSICLKNQSKHCHDATLTENTVHKKCARDKIIQLEVKPML